MKKLFLPFTFLLVVLLNSCVNDNPTQQLKENETQSPPILKELQKFGNPVISEILQNLPESVQQFSIDNSTDTILLGEEGSIISLTSFSFVDQNGNNPKKVKIELIEALSLADMIKYGLSTTSDDNILESDGMVFLNAYDSLNNQLLLKDGAYILIEIPALKAVPNIQLFTGSYDTNNTLNWSNPKPSERYLRKVSLSSLNFFPKDSNLLYTYQAINGPEDSVYYSCGLDSSLINPLYNSAFQNTLIATREFEQRMQYIHFSCDGDLLNLYIKNTTKSLWEIDSLASIYLKQQKSQLQDIFQLFTSQKLTTIKYSKPLNEGLYKAISNKIESLKKKKKIKTVLYNTLYSTSLGWINADRFINDTTGILTKMDVIVSNLKPDQKCNTSLILHDYKSILPLEQDNNGHFYIGKDGLMMLPPNTKGMIISISANDSLPLLAVKEVTVGSNPFETLTLEETSYEQFEKRLSEKIKPRKELLLDQSYTPLCCTPDELEL